MSVLGSERTAYPLMRRSGQQARAAGLGTRPLAHTFADELATLTAPPASGLSDDDQTALLAHLNPGVR